MLPCWISTNVRPRSYGTNNSHHHRRTVSYAHRPTVPLEGRGQPAPLILVSLMENVAAWRSYLRLALSGSEPLVT